MIKKFQDVHISNIYGLVEGLSNINWDIEKIRGHYVPYGKNKKHLHRNGVFLVGDASGGFVDPVMAKGIYYALLSGKLLADCINDKISENLIKRKYVQ